MHAADQVDIEYLPITPTLTKIRVHNKNRWAPIHNEILCYPITNVTKPIDLFAPFPKQTHAFVPVIASNPPNPPQRISSKESSTLKELTEARQLNGGGELSKKKSVADPETITVRNRNRNPASIRSRSASSITTSFNSLKDEKNFTNSSRIGREHGLRVSSLSPLGRKIEKRKTNTSPIAFGRSISKERTFAEEKKKQEERLPLCRRAWTASTNILRDPFVQSPKDVREAVRSTYQSPQTRERLTTTTSTRKTPSGNTIKTSAVTYAKDKLLKNAVKNDEKTIRMTTIETKPKGRVTAPTVVKTNLSKSSVSSETKLSPRSKQTLKTSSNVSLARTNSTYSIDSSSSKRRIRNRPYTIKSAIKTTIPPVTISNKPRKKKIDAKPTPITKPVPEEKIESYEYKTRTISPTRNGYERSSSFILVKDGNNKSVRNEKHEQIGTKSDKFFQNLFLRNIATNVETTAKDETVYQNTAVQEKAQFWNTIPRRTNCAKKKSPSIYLTQKQAVTGSKFKEIEKMHLRQARSLSPRRASPRSPKTIHFDRISKYNSFYQLSDEDDEEFGFDYHYQERSRSEPRSITYVQHVKTTPETKSNNGQAKQETTKQERPFSPTREIRSPSSRRIQSFRAQNKNADSHSRAQSADSHRRYHSLDLRMTRHRATDDGDNYESHLDLCSHTRSEKFKDLSRFYSKVERVGELERTTSNTDLHPIRKENELIDFDVWKQVRDYERAERELNSLVGKLKKVEKEKDFLFRPKYVEDIKWDQRNESGLRVKEKSVEDLKNIFIEKSVQNELDEARRRTIETFKDQYRSLWKGNSVLDLASNMTYKYNGPDQQRSLHFDGNEKRLGISRNLISTLSKDQVSKIKNQLTEIYSNTMRTTHKTCDAPPPSDEYVINVSEERNIRPTSLLVRSNSLVGEKELLKPVLQRQENRLKSSIKADSISAVHEARLTRSVDRYDSVVRRQNYSEDDKRKLLQQLGNEIRDKLKERREKVLQPRETRGAIAAEKTNIGCFGESMVSMHHTEEQSTTRGTIQSKLTSEVKTQAKYSKAEKKPEKPALVEIRPIEIEKISNEFGVPIEHSNEKIKDKIEYFEKKKDEEAPKTIYLPRDDSSPDEEEVIRVVEENVKVRQRQNQSKRSRLCGNGFSTSESDLKEIFGERESVRNLIEFRTPSPANTDAQSKNEWDAASIESYFRSRSISPICNSMHSTLKKSHFVDDGKFSYDSSTYKPPRSRPIFAVPPRRFKSDPMLNETTFRNQSPSKIVIKSHEAGDVSYITHKFELKKEAALAAAARGRTRTRRISSPIQRVAFKKEDRLMPHIDIISKTIALKEAISRSSTPKPTVNIDVSTTEVDKIRHKFETQQSPDRVSLIGQMYTSSPDISELKDISNYLSSTWIAHKYSKPNDNARSATEPEKGPASQEIKRKPVSRSSSISPLRTSQNVNEMLKPLYDIFADQNYDPMKHRPTHRYVPVDKRIEAEYLWRRLKQQSSGNRKNVKASVKSKG